MNDIAQGMKFTIDVKSGLVEMPQRAVLMKGDKNANRVTMALVDGEKAVSLEGATVTGTYVLAGIKMPLLGDVNENEATIILPDECYLASGRYELRMHVTLGSVKRTFLFITGYVESDGEGGTLDVEGVIPNIDDIIAQYDEMKRVTQTTQEAANAANEAASHAPYVGTNGNWFVWNAASRSYIDSGSKAQGPVGPQGPAGAEIDATLKVPGKAADAKATGDALSSLSEQTVNYRTAVNLLDNSDFRHPVNQRGQTSYTGTGNGEYAIDRWKTWVNGATLTIDDGYITVAGGAYVQYLTGIGGVYSAYAKKTDGTIIRLTTACESGADTRYVMLGDGEYLWAALYEGEYTAETLPPYVPKGYAAELAECQRYAVKINRMIAAGVCTLNGTAVLFIPLPVKMRGSLSVTEIGTLWSYGMSGANYQLSFAYPMNGNTGVELHFTTDTTTNEAITVPDISCFISADL